MYCIERLIWIWSSHTQKRKTVCKKRRPDRPGLIRSDKKIRSKKRNQNLDPPELRERLLPPRGGAGPPGGGSVYDLVMTMLLTMIIMIMIIQANTGCPKKNVLIECCWSHGAQAKPPVVGTTWLWKVFFWSFLTKTRQDQALLSHVHGKI